MSSYDKHSQVMKLKRRKRTSAKNEFDEAKEISVAVKTGKVLLGANSVIDAIASSDLKLIVVANNTPKDTLEKIKALNICQATPIAIYASQFSSSIDLGAICGKPFWISAIGIIEPGDSSLLKVLEK
jgi:large subunit ribosomal protein L30e